MGRAKKERRIAAQKALNKQIDEVVQEAYENEDALKQIAKESQYLGIINKAKMNRCLNSYIVKELLQVDKVNELNTRLVDKLLTKRELAEPSELLKMYIENKKLENEKIKLLTEFCKVQHFDLEQPEREIIIIYRCLEPVLQRLLYKTIMEFVVTCPAIVNNLKEKSEA